MISDSMTVEEIRLHLGTALKEKDFVVDKTGVKTIEIIGASKILRASCRSQNPSN